MACFFIDLYKHLSCSKNQKYNCSKPKNKLVNKPKNRKKDTNIKRIEFFEKIIKKYAYSRLKTISKPQTCISDCLT